MRRADTLTGAQSMHRTSMTGVWVRGDRGGGGGRPHCDKLRSHGMRG